MAMKGSIKKVVSRAKEAAASYAEVTDAFNTVRAELTAMGLLFDGTPLDKVDCIYAVYDIVTPWTGTMGYCFENGNIHIPAIFPKSFEGYSRDLLDVIRHEFGHALADRYNRFFKVVFKDAFGREYGAMPAEKDVVDWEEEYVSEYATTATREDWAETFMLFMKVKGKIPSTFARKPAIRKKWEAVRTIVARIAESI